ncbi:MAG TPA: RIP metalloprotease RseP [Gammaproteobacteria bacterium]
MGSGGLLHNLLFFIIAIGVLVAFHEFGHYWVARLLKVKVLRFSIGFGKPLFVKKVQKGDDLIEFVVAAIPLGGYVKMLDEREGPVDESLRHRAFNTQPLSTRFAIVAAGPIFNFILAVFLYFIFFVNGEDGIKPMIAEPVEQTAAAVAGFEDGDEIVAVAGQPVRTWNEFRMALIEHGIDGGDLVVDVRSSDLYQTQRIISIGDRHILNEKNDVVELLGFSVWRPDIPAVIGGVSEAAPAEQSGLQAGDRIVSIDQQPVSNWQQVVEIIQASANTTLQINISRDGETREITLQPEVRERGDQLLGFMGAYPEVSQQLLDQSRVRLEYGLFEAMQRATVETWTFSVLTLKVLGKMLVGQAALENISGPITIAQYAGITASIGFLIYIKFLAMISVSLGVLNLLPVPMLDGGHLMYYLVELVKGSPVSQRVEQLGQQVGIALLFLLMSLAIFNDIQRLLN